MPIIRRIDNDDQNIARIRTKMSENFTGQNSAKLPLSSVEAAVNYFANNSNIGPKEDEFGLPYDHMYASNTENGEVSVTGENCQGAESEVTFWKEWLILHLDLIQQQSDEILDKERTIVYLQQENEMLKERISCMERGAPFQPDKFFNATLCDGLGGEDMTQDSGPLEEENKNCIELLALNCENGTSLTLVDYAGSQQNGSNLTTEEHHHPTPNISQVNYIDSASATLKTENSEAPLPETNISTQFDLAISSTSDFDPMKNLRMSIRRKRLSNSSVFSNNNDNTAVAAATVAGLDEKRSFQRYRKKRKRTLKDTEILTTADQYVTQSGEIHVGISSATEPPLEVPNSANLEVPRWRVKLYASCYSMEGTENLDDEVYNKRHLRLENDERRRKRWDVQRIREQRVIEKLKQRQDRTGPGGRSDDQNEAVQSLWPKVEDIKYLEVTDDVPVSAFGCLIPKIPAREFSLPWLNNPSVLAPKKVSARKATSRRRNLRR